MKSIRMRLAAVATSTALIVGTGGIASIALAATGGPTATLATSSGIATNVPVHVTANFSNNVTGFSSSSVTVSNGTVSNVAGSGASYSFDVTPTAQGQFDIQVMADKVQNASSTGNQASNVLSLLYDTAAPTITDVTVNPITASCATINWTSNETVSGQISYGPTTSYGSTATSSASGTQHNQLCGLNASTTYNYQIRATDAAGNAATSSNATFTTLASNATSTGPVISNVMVTVNSTSSATISYMTSATSTGFVSYGTTSGYGTNTSTEGTASTTHSVTLNGLSEATLYHYKISQTSSGGTTTTTDATFTTQGTASSTPLALVSTQAVNTTATADGTFEHGFKWVLTFTVPENQTNLQMRFTDFTSSSSSSTIPAANNIRIYSAQSSTASSTTSALTSTNNEYGTAMTLTGDSDAVMAGRQVQVTVEVKVPFGTAPASGYTTTFGARTSTP